MYATNHNLILNMPYEVMYAGSKPCHGCGVMLGRAQPFVIAVAHCFRDAACSPSMHWPARRRCIANLPCSPPIGNITLSIKWPRKQMSMYWPHSACLLSPTCTSTGRCKLHGVSHRSQSALTVAWRLCLVTATTASSACKQVAGPHTGAGFATRRVPGGAQHGRLHAPSHLQKGCTVLCKHEANGFDARRLHHGRWAWLPKMQPQQHTAAAAGQS
jgi:hypothetical protein